VMSVRTFTAAIYWEADETGEEGIYVAECPEVGTASQSDTIEEAVANLKEATELYLEEASAEGGRHPFVTTFEVEVAETTRATAEETIRALEHLGFT
jgi:predicted RNase H-like HicB family nuclease